jgi:hypothetical protein
LKAPSSLAPDMPKPATLGSEELPGYGLRQRGSSHHDRAGVNRSDRTA